MKKKIIVQKMTKNLFSWLIVVSFLLTPGYLFAGSGVALRSIPPVVDEGNFKLDIPPEAYFDMVGRLNAIDNQRLVVDDKELKCASGLRGRGVKKWNLVGVKLNKAGQVVEIKTISDEPN